MSDIINRVRASQVAAGEAAVMADLAGKGLLPDAPPTRGQERRIGAPIGLAAEFGTPNVVLGAPGYELLAAVLKRAFDQAAIGKGKERHAVDATPFHEQPMALINKQIGSVDGFIYQAHKKSLEALRLPHGRAQAELLGAINYLAGAVIALDTWAAPRGEATQAAQV